jgi:hypothetical protein
MADPSLTIRVPQPIGDRLNSAVNRAGCTKTEWVLEAIRYALERDEAPHVPAVIKAAMPRRIGNSMRMPEGIVLDQFGPR